MSRDVAAERAVMASVFAYGAEAFDDVSDLLTRQTFSETVNRDIYRCVEHHYADGQRGPIDVASVQSSARALGIALDGEESARYLRALQSFPVKQGTARRLAAKLRKLEIARYLHEQLGRAQARLEEVTGDEPVDIIRAIAEGPAFDLPAALAERHDGPRRVGQGLREYVERLGEDPVESVGIPTGFPLLDRSIGGGLRPNSLDVVGARMKAGKSFLGNSVSLHVAGRLGVPVLNVDTEMTWEEQAHRAAAAMSGVPIDVIETGQFSRSDVHREKLLEACRRLEDSPYYHESVIDKSFEEVLAVMRRWVTRVVGLDGNGHAKPCVIVYDYLKLLSTDFLKDDLREHQALGFVATGLKNFMGRYRARCLAFAQLNREGIEREDEAALADSDRINRYGTSFTIFKKKTDEERHRAPDWARKYTHRFIPVLSRHGKGVEPGDSINVQADYARALLREGCLQSAVEAGHNPEALLGDELPQLVF